MPKARKPHNKKSVRDLSPAVRKRQASLARRMGYRNLSTARRSKAFIAAARGHRNEKVERQERRQKIRAQHGTTPEQLARLRKEAVAHIAAEMSGGKSPVNLKTVRKNVGRMTLPALRQTLGMTRRAMLDFSWDDIDYDFGDFEDDEHPFWYH